MRALVLVLAIVALAPAAPLAAAEPGPCPHHCTPPEPCGWAPKLTDPVAYAAWLHGCARHLLA